MVIIMLSIDIVIGGILLGGIYALTALGLSMIFGVSKTLNIAHGDLVVLNAALAFIISIVFTQNLFLIISISIVLLCVIGLAFEKALIKPLYKKPSEFFLISTIIVTIGASMIIQDLTSWGMGLVYGGSHFGFGYIMPPFIIGGVPISGVRLILLLLVSVIIVFLHIFLRKTYAGKAIRATIQDREIAMALSVNVDRISTATFIIGVVLAAIAGLFMILIATVSTYGGLPLTFKALTIVILGGMGSFVGTLIGALIIGLVESFTSYYAGTAWSPVMAFLILIIMLMIRPQGLMGRKYAG